MTANSKTVYRKDYQIPNYLILQTDLEFIIKQDYVLVNSKLNIALNPDLKLDGSCKLPQLILNGENLELLELTLNGKNIDYEITKTHLSLQPLDPNFIVETKVRIYPHKNTALEGLYKSGAMFCTQCEAEGFHKITYFIDRPDVLSKFKVTISADANKYPQLLSNGNLISSTENNGIKTVVWQDPFAKPCYLFALVAGNLACAEDEFITKSGRSIKLQLFTDAQNLPKTAHAINSLKRAMRWDEQVYGLEYDLDLFMIVAVHDFNSGAMENKGLNIFNTACVLADKDIATDAAFARVEGVVAHEYFHNYSGNRVTCRDWFQLSLKEGFTVFRDSEFSADMNSRAVKRIEDVAFLRSNQFSEDSSPLAHAVRPDSYLQIRNFYTLTVYEKGAEVVRMLHTLLGAENFRRGSDIYFAQFDGKAVTCDDFVHAMEQASGEDLSQFMLWYSQVGTPKVLFSDNYDAQNQTYSLTFEQQNEPLLIPISLCLFDEQGSELPNSKQVFRLKQKQQTLVFTNIAHKPIPSLLRGFSAPIELQAKSGYAPNLLKLLQYETDSFNRWDVCQQIMLNNLRQIANNFAQEQSPIFDQNSIAVLKEVIINEQDLALSAQLLTLPNINYLMEGQGVVNIEAILSAYKFMREFIANEFAQYLVKTYQNLRTVSCETKYEPSKNHIARRSLQNIALWYLTAGNKFDALNALQEQYYQSDNLTERLSALTYLVHAENIADIHKVKALDDFEARFGHEPLAMDQWFSVQASCDLPGYLIEIKKLLDHPKFSLNNPNRVRSVIGAFAMRNLGQFHQINGQGYKFVAEQIIKLDVINSQIAARLVAPFSKWRKFDDARQNLMRTQLETIKNSPNLSPDVLEQVTRIL